MYKTALTAAVRHGDRRAGANFHYLLANASRMICDFDIATKHLADARRWTTSRPDYLPNVA
jgi:hypothetical protein